MAPDYIFCCRKCEHQLYVNKFNEKKISNLPETHCPGCGEEGHMNWIAMGEGDYGLFEGEKIGEEEDSDSGRS
jgi:hypothetical protein